MTYDEALKHLTNQFSLSDQTARNVLLVAFRGQSAWFGAPGAPYRLVHNQADGYRVLDGLVGLAEVASLAGKTKRRAWQITRQRDFPAPVQTLAMGPVWLERDVQKFLEAQGAAPHRSA